MVINENLQNSFALNSFIPPAFFEKSKKTQAMQWAQWAQKSKK